MYFFSRHSATTFFSTLGDRFFLTCMQRRGNRLGTFGHHRRASRRIGKRQEVSVNPWELLETVGNLHVERFVYTFSSRNRSGIGFMSSRLAGNDSLGLGSSKIEAWAKNTKKNIGKSMVFFVFFPLVGSDA